MQIMESASPESNRIVLPVLNHRQGSRFVGVPPVGTLMHRHDKPVFDETQENKSRPPAVCGRTSHLPVAEFSPAMDDRI